MSLAVPPDATTAEIGRGSSDLFGGGGEMGALMRSTDWAATDLGPAERWPQSLRTAVSILLGTGFPTYIAWGPGLTQLYNDAFRPILGSQKHPAALGNSSRETFAEVWETLSPLFADVFQGATVNLADLKLFVDRHGFTEEVHFYFSYSPIQDESGRVGGILCTTLEITDRIIGARRLQALQALTLETQAARSAQAACAIAARVLGESRDDLPFVLVYTIDDDGETARLAGAAGVAVGTTMSPARVDLEADHAPWPLAAVARAVAPRVLETAELTPWTVPAEEGRPPLGRAMLVPIVPPGHEKPAGVLVVRASALLLFDEGYRSFIETAGRYLGTALASARAYEEARQQAEALAELDRAKTAFFSNVSHELRTPLTLILGPTEDALGSPGGALAGEELERVHGNAQRLLKLVNALLEFSRVEAGRTRAAFQPTDLAALTAELASAFESVIGAAGLDFVIDCPPLPEPLWVDPSMWEKVVLNLVSNAFKFTLAGHVAVRLRWTGEGAELTVEDTGVGLAPEELPRVFQRFHRVEGSQGRSHEGSGIGLSLVKELVRLHGGEASVESTLGAGSTFTVTLPAGSAHLPAQDVEAEARPLAKSAATAAFVREASHWLPADGAGDQGAPSSAAPNAGALLVGTDPSLRVLVADDNRDMRAYVERVLSGHFLVESVADGREALASARRHPPGLVLSDVMMPVMDGMALTRALREDARTRDVPVILLSARAGEDATVEGLEAGADDYIVKPFSARELVARVQGAVRLARAEAARRRALERVSEVLESTSDGFGAIDAEWRLTAANASYARLSQMRREDVLGRSVWELFPAARDPASRPWQELHRCMRERVSVHFVEHYAPLDLWTDVRADPDSQGGLTVWFRDVSDEVRSRALLTRQAEFEQQLIGIVSHDLRDPLNLIVMAADLLADPGFVSDEARDVVQRVQKAAERAARLVRDLLDFTQARLGGGIHVLPRPVDPHALMRDVLADVRPAFPDRRIELRQTGDGQGQWDPDRLAQVMQNLVTNALKYSPRDSAVEVETNLTPREATLLVHNGGVPIPPDKLPVLFEPMQRATEQVDRRSRSVGLGLYIVKKIVEAHRGTVEVRSTERDGTTFLVKLPRAAAR